MKENINVQKKYMLKKYHDGVSPQINICLINSILGATGLRAKIGWSHFGNELIE